MVRDKEWNKRKNYNYLQRRKGERVFNEEMKDEKEIVYTAKVC